MPRFWAVSIIIFRVAEQNAGSIGICITLSSLLNIVNIRFLVLKINIYKIIQYNWNHKELMTHKSMKESKITKSPGLISSFKEPVADDAIICVHPRCFKAQILAR